jgi:hypothetical protein
MKHQLTACFTKALFALAGLSVCSTALAQPPVPYHPSAPIAIRLVFTGPDAARLQKVGAVLHAPIPDNQTGLIGDILFDASNSRPDGPGRFIIQSNTGTNVATGTYRLTSIRAWGTTSDGVPVDISYGENECPKLEIKVESTSRFIRPVPSDATVVPSHP